MEIIRKPSQHWTNGSLNWTTEFNDLRRLPGSEENIERALLRDLKRLCIFNSKVVLRDADIVNNLILQKIISLNYQYIQKSILSGSIIQHIRDHAQDISEVNESTGKFRAFPERYEPAKSFSSWYDRFINDNGLVCMSTGLDGSTDVFRKIITEPLYTGRLTPTLEEKLINALEQVDRNYGRDESLRFGHIYDYLVVSQGEPEHSDIIRFIRTGHSLAIPKELGINQTSAAGDLYPDHVQCFYNTDIRNLENMSLVNEFFPKRIIPEHILDKLNFIDIEKIRSIGKNIGYFDVVSKVQQASPLDFEKSYISYLNKLNTYLVEIGVYSKVELIDWQYEILEKHLNNENHFVKLAVWGVPVMISIIPAVIMSSIIPFTIGIATGTAIDKISEYYKARTNPVVNRYVRGNQSHSTNIRS